MQVKMNFTQFVNNFESNMGNRNQQQSMTAPRTFQDAQKLVNDGVPTVEIIDNANEKIDDPPNKENHVSPQLIIKCEAQTQTDTIDEGVIDQHVATVVENDERVQ